MKSYKVSEDFIKEAHNAACSEWANRIEEQFPQVFKPKIEGGKWYKCKSKTKLTLFCSTNGKLTQDCGYGFDHLGGWKNPFNLLGSHPSDFTKANLQEIEKALIEEAVRRGFKNGVKVNRGNWYNALGNSIIIIDKSTYPAYEGFSFEDGILMLNGFILFKDGFWAEIVNQDRTYKIGDRITIDDDDTYLICRVGTNTISLVSSAGESWDYTVQVINENKITKKELNDHIGDYKWKLT